MQEDLTEEYLNQLAPWDYRIKIAEEVYPTIAPTVGDVIAIEEMERDGKATIKNLRAILGRLFADPRPPIDSWQFPFMVKVMRHIFAHWTSTLKKNALASPPTAPPLAAKQGESSSMDGK